MSSIHYDKLVRDRIPQVIRSEGKEPVTEVVPKEEIMPALNRKLQEEVREYLESGSVEEMADILEVLHGIAFHMGVAWDEVESVRAKKRDERGGFEDGIRLLEVRDNGRKSATSCREASLTPADMKVIQYLSQMDASFSYRDVLALALLENAGSDGMMSIPAAISFFRAFYQNRMDRGLPAELKESVFSDPKVSDTEALVYITKCAILPMLSSCLFEYQSSPRQFGFDSEIWKKITIDGRKQMAETVRERLAKYYGET